MCIHVHLPAPVAVKLFPSYLLHLDFMCEKKRETKPQTFLTVCINITKQQNNSNFKLLYLTGKHFLLDRLFYTNRN